MPDDIQCFFQLGKGRRGPEEQSGDRQNAGQDTRFGLVAILDQILDRCRPLGTNQVLHFTYQPLLRRFLTDRETGECTLRDRNDENQQGSEGEYGIIG